MYCLVAAILLVALPLAQATLFPIVRHPAHCAKSVCIACTLIWPAAVMLYQTSSSVKLPRCRLLSVTWYTLQKKQCANQPGSYLVQHTYSKLDKVISAGTCQVRGCAVQVRGQGGVPSNPEHVRAARQL